MARLARAAAENAELCQAVRTAAGDIRLDPIKLDTWVRGHFRYRGEEREVIRTPEFMWSEWQTTGTFEGDCDDVSTMFAFILRCLGYPLVRFVAIRFDSNNPYFEHVYVELYYAGAWRVFDQTVAPGTRHNIVERMVQTV